VIRSQSPSVIPFSVTSVPMRPVLHSASFLYVGVPVFKIRDTGGATDLLVRNSAPRKRLLPLSRVGRSHSRARQCRRRAQREASDHTGSLHRGKRAPADNCAGAWRANQVRLMRGGRTARQEPGRRRSRLGRLEGQGDAEIDLGRLRPFFAAWTQVRAWFSETLTPALRCRKRTAKPTGWPGPSGHDTYIGVSAASPLGSEPSADKRMDHRGAAHSALQPYPGIKLRFSVCTKLERLLDPTMNLSDCDPRLVGASPPHNERLRVSVPLEAGPSQ
jgi:hypothetical protein